MSSDMRSDPDSGCLQI